MNLLISTIATGNYTSYLKDWLDTARQFIDPSLNPKFLILHNFSEPIYTDEPDVLEHLIERSGWPFETLFRFRRYLSAKHILEQFDYFLYVDADMKFAGKIGMEIIPIGTNNNLVSVIHPGFYQPERRGTFEDDRNSIVCIPPDYRGTYFQGCVWGGRTTSVLNLCKVCDAWVTEDRLKGIFTTWWDEAYLNYYFMLNSPEVQLHPGYAYPEHWMLPFQKKIIHIAKDELKMRSDSRL